MSRDWLFVSVKLSSTLLPTHVVRTFAPRAPRTENRPQFSRESRADRCFRSSIRGKREDRERSGRISGRKSGETTFLVRDRAFRISIVDVGRSWRPGRQQEGLKPRVEWLDGLSPDEDRARANCSRGRSGWRGCPIILLIDASAFPLAQQRSFKMKIRSTGRGTCSSGAVTTLPLFQAAKPDRWHL